MPRKFWNDHPDKKILFPMRNLLDKIRKMGYELKGNYYFVGPFETKFYYSYTPNISIGRDSPFQWYPRVRTNSDEVARIAEPYAVVIRIP